MKSNNFKILLVEDHKILTKFMTMVFSSAGCTVDIASTGEEALNLFKNNQYHLILMDIGLPDGNGLSFIEKMRSSSNLSKASTPIVITSAHSDEEYKIKAQNLGVANFIVKPCSVEDCHALIKEYSPS